MLVTRDLQQGTDWLATGKILFYIGSGQPIMKANKQGLPVDLAAAPDEGRRHHGRRLLLHGGDEQIAPSQCDEAFC